MPPGIIQLSYSDIYNDDLYCAPGSSRLRVLELLMSLHSVLVFLVILWLDVLWIHRPAELIFLAWQHDVISLSCVPFQQYDSDWLLYMIYIIRCRLAYESTLASKRLLLDLPHIDFLLVSTITVRVFVTTPSRMMIRPNHLPISSKTSLLSWASSVVPLAEFIVINCA